MRKESRTVSRTVDDGFQWIEDFTNLEKNPPGSTRAYRLDRMRRLAALMGNPQKEFNTIHLAGSKGKGSTGIITASLLEAAGCPCGLYTSPHAFNYRERITQAGRFFPEEIYQEALEELRQGTQGFQEAPTAGEGSPQPTTFELLTLLAWLVFRRAGLSWVVLETGLGGRLDATNILSSPRAVIITPIEREHTNLLGNTLEAIAGEKAGIIKPGVPVFLSRQDSRVIPVFREKCRAVKAPLTLPEEAGSITVREISPRGTLFSWEHTGRGHSVEAQLPLMGEHQAENAGTALCTVTSLFPDLTVSTLRRGLEQARLPARFQRILQDPDTYLDGCHTPASVQGAADTLARLIPGDSRPILLFGAVNGKESPRMAEILAPRFAAAVVTRPGRFRSSDPPAAAACFRHQGIRTILEEDPGQALCKARQAAGPHGTVLILGSFYLAGEILAHESVSKQ